MTDWTVLLFARNWSAAYAVNLLGRAQSTLKTNRLWQQFFTAKGTYFCIRCIVMIPLSVNLIEVWRSNEI
jgi:hypothetical protein